MGASVFPENTSKFTEEKLSLKQAVQPGSCSVPGLPLPAVPYSTGVVL